MMKAFYLSACSALALLLLSQAPAMDLAGSEDAAPPPPAAARFPQFEFPGGTLVEFVVAFRELASAHFPNPPNIVVSPSAESRPVPPIEVRSVSAEILLQLVARLAGANLETIVPNDEDSSAAVYILDAPNSPDSTLFGAGDLHFGGPFAIAEVETGAYTRPSVALEIPEPASEFNIDPAATAPLNPSPRSLPQGFELSHDLSVTSGRPLLDSVFDPGLPPSSPAPTRFVIPMFVGLLFDESEEGRKKQDELHAILVEYVHSFFPDANSDLSMHGESGVLIVESSSQAAVDFVRAFLEARREAEIFRLKQQQVDAGVRSAEVLLEQSPQRR